MQLFGREELKGLIDVHGQPCISIYMPTARRGLDTEQNHIRYKNQLRDVEAKMKEAGYRKNEIDMLLDPARPLLENNRFWQYQDAGLAVFLHENDFQYYRLPLSFNELSVIGERFYVKPLMPLVTANGQFYILTVSQGGVKLHRCSRHTIAEVDLANMPGSIKDVIKWEMPEKELQFHTATPGRGNNRDAIHYGTGDADRDRRDVVLRYFQQVDDGLREILRDDRSPIVPVGLDSLLPIYREANKLQTLTEDAVTVNPTDLTDQQLHERAWPIVEPIFTASRRDALSEFERHLQARDGRVSIMLEEVISAASQGRVKALFLKEGEERWGVFSVDQQQASLHERQEPGDEDLLDTAAVYTFNHGGDVHILSADRMPADTEIAAVYRY
ncbi:hypothetical protein GF420_11655 [candidate division GN15 bacterium]|nr:hypothetical protein [candidate division GN15 bacterium]